MAKQTADQKAAIEELRGNIASAEPERTLRPEIAEALRVAKDNPVWRMEIDEMEELLKTHVIGSNPSGWRNPYPKTDPRSTLLEYQFVPFHDRSRFKLQLQGRQTGKDYTLEGEAVEDCFSRKTNWMIGAPSERQSLDSLEQAKLWARAFDLQIADYQEQRMGRDSTTLLKSAEIVYTNGSTHIAVPGRPDTVRGKSVNIGLTEADFFEKPFDTWRAILPSITNPLRGGLKKARIVSTPNGKAGLMWKFSTSPAGAKIAWSVHTVNLYHAVLMGLPVDPEEIREAMDDPEGFAQECLCEFLDGSNVLLPYELIQLAESFDATEACSLDDLVGGKIYCGIDFGRSNDPTVCWTLQEVGGILWTREVLVLRNMPSHEQETILGERIKRAQRVSFDYTGPGIGLGDYLVKAHGQWKPEDHKLNGKVELVTFTAKLKREMFPNLRRRFEAPTTLRIPSSTTIREDLHEMRQVIKNAEYNYWSPRTKDGHSDRCTALALAVRAFGDGERAPVTAETFARRRVAKYV